jgi:hypothetical protein
MFCDESTFSLVNPVTVRRGKTMNRYKHKLVLKTVKHSANVTVWGCFSGKKGHGGLYFKPKKLQNERGEVQELSEEAPPPLHEEKVLTTVAPD